MEEFLRSPKHCFEKGIESDSGDDFSGKYSRDHATFPEGITNTSPQSSDGLKLKQTNYQISHQAYNHDLIQSGRDDLSTATKNINRKSISDHTLSMAERLKIRSSCDSVWYSHHGVSPSGNQQRELLDDSFASQSFNENHQTLVTGASIYVASGSPIFKQRQNNYYGNALNTTSNSSPQCSNARANLDFPSHPPLSSNFSSCKITQRSPIHSRCNQFRSNDNLRSTGEMNQGANQNFIRPDWQLYSSSNSYLPQNRSHYQSQCLQPQPASPSALHQWPNSQLQQQQQLNQPSVTECHQASNQSNNIDQYGAYASFPSGPRPSSLLSYFDAASANSPMSFPSSQSQFLHNKLSVPPHSPTQFCPQSLNESPPQISPHLSSMHGQTQNNRLFPANSHSRVAQFSMGTPAISESQQYNNVQQSNLHTESQQFNNVQQSNLHTKSQQFNNVQQRDLLTESLRLNAQMINNVQYNNPTSHLNKSLHVNNASEIPSNNLTDSHKGRGQLMNLNEEQSNCQGKSTSLEATEHGKGSAFQSDKFGAPFLRQTSLGSSKDIHSSFEVTDSEEIVDAGRLNFQKDVAEICSLIPTSTKTLCASSNDKPAFSNIVSRCCKNEKTTVEIIGIEAASRSQLSKANIAETTKEPHIIKNMQSKREPQFLKTYKNKRSLSTNLTQSGGKKSFLGNPDVEKCAKLEDKNASVSPVHNGVEEKSKSEFANSNEPNVANVIKSTAKIYSIDDPDSKKAKLRATICKYCKFAQVLRSALHCDRCKKPLYNMVTTETNSEEVKSSVKANKPEEKQDVILELSKKQFDELESLAKNYDEKEAPDLRLKNLNISKIYEEPEILTLSSDDEDPLHRGFNKFRLINNCRLPPITAHAVVKESPLKDSEKISLSGGGVSYDEDLDFGPVFESAPAVLIRVGNWEVPKVEGSPSLANWVTFKKDLIEFKFQKILAEPSTLTEGKEEKKVESVMSARISPAEIIGEKEKNVKSMMSARTSTAAESETKTATEIEWLKLRVEDIEQIRCNLKEEDPSMFIIMKPDPVEQIKRQIGIAEHSAYNFNPTSSDHKIKFIILKFRSLSEEKEEAILSYFDNNFIKQEDKATMKILLHSALVKDDEDEQASQTLLIYPPPPSRGGITITTKDYFCLEEGQFLNDVILDFYLKYLMLEKLSEKDRQRTHVFSTFFYKRLTSPKKGIKLNNNSNMSKEEIRHARVKSWTKDIDIFEKDFIIIPINQRSHWFLAIICYPGLDYSDELTINQEGIARATCENQPTKKLNKVQNPVVEDLEASDKDEAESEGEDFDMEAGTQERKSKEEENPQRKSEMQGVKRPCILIFDSLSGASHRRIVATLRDYLIVEYYEKKKRRKTFKDTMKGAAYPSVPQQTNFTDCGIFTLQFAESFLENPLKFPIPNLSNWFERSRVASKREDIAKMIEGMMSKFRPDHGVNLPNISFKSLLDEKAYALKEAKKEISKSTVIEPELPHKSKDETNDIDKVEPEEKQSSFGDPYSEEIICEEILRPNPVKTMPKIPKKRPTTPGPFQKPEPTYKTPLVGLYVNDPILQRSIDAKSISITGFNCSPISNNKTVVNNNSSNKSLCGSNSSHFSQPNTKTGSNFPFRGRSSSLEGGGKKFTAEEDDVIFDNEVLKPTLGNSPHKPVAALSSLKNRESHFGNSSPHSLSNNSKSVTKSFQKIPSTSYHPSSRKRPLDSTFCDQKRLNKK